MQTTGIPDIERKIIRTELLNEKTLLVISKADDEEYPCISIKYEKHDKIQSKILTRLTPEVKVEYTSQMIALFHKQGKVVKRNKLISVYDTKNHEFIEKSDMRLHYDCVKYKEIMVKKLVANKK